MSYEFKIGQRVVCVNESIVGVMINPSDQFFPRIGRLYTITGFETRNTPLDAALLCLLLKEHEVSFGRSGAWGVYRFRPLVSDTQPWLKRYVGASATNQPIWPNPAIPTGVLLHWRRAMPGHLSEVDLE